MVLKFTNKMKRLRQLFIAGIMGYWLARFMQPFKKQMTTE